MSEHNEETTGLSSSTVESADIQQNAISSTYKVRGKDALSDGAGVLGTNTATSGTPIGVEGTVADSSVGYGLATPDDVRIEGIIDTNDTDFTVKTGTVTSQDARNIVAGHASNEVTDGAEGATIAGGGFDDGSTVAPNTVHDQYGTVGGGAGNEAGTPDSDPSTAKRATVGGGFFNLAKAAHATVSGGQQNEASGAHATIAGGQENVVYDNLGTVGGGSNNQAGTSDGDSSSAEYAAVGGGAGNEARDDWATVGGGRDNEASGSRSTVGGGVRNKASGANSTVPGGRDNTASGSHSYAAGTAAKAKDFGCFVFADYSFDSDAILQPFSSDAGLGPTGDYTFSVRATGGARIGTSVDSNGDIDAGVKVSSGSGSWSSLSTRELKSNIQAVKPQSVLEDVERLEISTWEYDGQRGVSHMGPMAEEFHEHFELGPDSKSIASVDADGVALAAIQGLSEKLDEKDDRIDDQKAQIDALEAENDRLRDRISTLEERVSAVEAGAAKPGPADD